MAGSGREPPAIAGGLGRGYNARVMALTNERLREMVAELMARPGHEKVRALVYDLLIYGLGARSVDVDFERALPEVRGRVDALLGQTVFEFKRDLRRERRDAEEELSRYLPQRELETGERFVGIATDGNEWQPYEMRRGRLAELERFTPSKEDPRSLLVWLDGVVSITEDQAPDPDVVRSELGRSSLAYQRAQGTLGEVWSVVEGQPEVKLKRQLWADLLSRAYGSRVESDDLFFQHTYLTIVAKAMAVHVVDVGMPSPEDLLSGRPFRDASIDGAVESDFFDWVLADRGGVELVQRIVRQVARFRLADVESDVLKSLYESLIDPEQRHELGEYYTPDWLAYRMCEHAVERPLEQRVLDPGCGSGTFLFHAIRRLLAAADGAGCSNREAVDLCCSKVLGIDVHPVAVIIARVTYLLALGEERLTRKDRPEISIPVYLGDSLQWNTKGFFAHRDVLISVPDGPTLEFPYAVAGDPGKFDAVIGVMLELSEQNADSGAIKAWLKRHCPVDRQSANVLAATYDALRGLKRDRRNHIWGYVARNLSRPVWLSSASQRADVVIGNPPWLSYRYMDKRTQERFRTECQDRSIWAGGKVATHQDLSGYFFARCVELYVRMDGSISFVMPYAALNRLQFEGFRRGWFGKKKHRSKEVFASVRFTEAWAFDEDVQPLFPVPSCVLFARPGGTGPLPEKVLAAKGTLPRRDATAKEADKSLTWRKAPWPESPSVDGGSGYREAFRQGATMVPRVLCVVETAAAGRFGGSGSVPVVESRRTSQEKPPWKSLPPLRGAVEQEFLKPLYLGECIAPFRLLEPVLAVIPWDERGRRLLDAESARRSGYIHVSEWLSKAEGLWDKHGRGRMRFAEQVDYYGKLSSQFPITGRRVLYSKAGSQPAAAVLRGSAEAVVDHKLYWAAATEDEALYLVAILNSETARSRVAHMQSRGQWGARDFDKLILGLPIPKFDPKAAVHRQLVAAARRAEEVAAGVPFKEGMHFVRARGIIREALAEDGVSARIDELVARLLGT